MIYKDFETIPYKLLVKIIETGNVKLLTDDESVLEEELHAIWSVIYSDYSVQNQNDEETRVFKIQKEIEYYESKYKVIMVGCEALEFGYNQDIADAFEEAGYYINESNYFEKIDGIRRQCEGLLIAAESHRENLPKPDKNNTVTVDDILASYSTILQIDFDFNTVPASKVIALGKQIDKKIKALTQNNKK